MYTTIQNCTRSPRFIKYASTHFWTNRAAAYRKTARSPTFPYSSSWPCSNHTHVHTERRVTAVRGHRARSRASNNRVESSGKHFTFTLPLKWDCCWLVGRIWSRVYLCCGQRANGVVCEWCQCPRDRQPVRARFSLLLERRTIGFR